MEILRLAAFTKEVSGGNPAGVVLDATGISDERMLATASDVGFSETAFMFPRPDGDLDIRYFSPMGEVPFCGHATIATAIAYASRVGPGTINLHTKAGPVTVRTDATVDETLVATLVSVPPRVSAIDDADLAELLHALRWSHHDLEPALPPRVAYAGNSHPIVAAAARSRLAHLDYDMTPLADLMDRKDWTTVNLIWREAETVFHARNPFPPGGVFEDPATGSAAAALGGYLKALGLVVPPVTVTVYQGHDMGRPSTIEVAIPAEPGSGIAVSGTAVPLA